eukprot:scaffold2021_cov121-Isochrysis_galbana.AAC.3
MPQATWICRCCAPRSRQPVAMCALYCACCSALCYMSLCGPQSTQHPTGGKAKTSTFARVVVDAAGLPSSTTAALTILTASSS